MGEDGNGKRRKRWIEIRAMKNKGDERRAPMEVRENEGVKRENKGGGCEDHHSVCHCVW